MPHGQNFYPTRFFLPWARSPQEGGTYLPTPTPEVLLPDSPLSFDEQPPMIVVRTRDLARDQLSAIAQQQAVVAATPAKPVLGPGGEIIKPPWEVPPPDAQPFDFVGIIVTPALGAVNTVVLTFTVPFGWDGVIKGISNRYIGAGFVEGSGDLIWRIFVAAAAARNYDSIQVTFGTGDQNRRVEGNGIRLYSTEVVQYTVSVAAAAAIPVGPGTNVICGCSGYFYPTP